VTISIFDPNVGITRSPKVLRVAQGTFRCIAKYFRFSACAVAPLHFERKLGHRAIVACFGPFDYIGKIQTETLPKIPRYPTDRRWRVLLIAESPPHCSPPQKTNPAPRLSHGGPSQDRASKKIPDTGSGFSRDVDCLRRARPRTRFFGPHRPIAGFRRSTPPAGGPAHRSRRPRARVQARRFSLLRGSRTGVKLCQSAWRLMGQPVCCRLVACRKCVVLSAFSVIIDRA